MELWLFASRTANVVEEAVAEEAVAVCTNSIVWVIEIFDV